jgi:hypothetical protein
MHGYFNKFTISTYAGLHRFTLFQDIIFYALKQMMIPVNLYFGITTLTLNWPVVQLTIFVSDLCTKNRTDPK